MWRLSALVALFVSFGGQVRHAALSFTSSTVTWYADVDAASVEAAARHKPLLVFFGAEWDCGTKELRTQTLQDPEVRSLLQHDFVAVDIDASDDELPETRRDQTRFKVIGLPTLIILEPDAKTELRRFNQFITPETLADALRETRK